MKSVALRLPDEVSQRLKRLADLTGRSRTFYMIEAIREHLDDLEDLYLAEQRLIDIRAGKSQTVPLEDVMKRYGVGRLSLTPPPCASWASSTNRRHGVSWSFCMAALPRWTIRADSGRPSRVPRWVSFGSTGWAIIASSPALRTARCACSW